MDLDPDFVRSMRPLMPDDPGADEPDFAAGTLDDERERHCGVCLLLAATASAAVLLGLALIARPYVQELFFGGAQ